MYESRYQPLLTLPAFIRRMGLHLLGAMLLVLGSVLVGAAGFAVCEDMALNDALLNSTAMLSGMGIVYEPHTGAGKLFSAGFSLYAGLIFVAAAGILLAPLVHRLLHSFHWQDQ